MKTVLVTGGARGIGKAISKKFADEGWRVLINYNTSEKAALEIVKEIGEDRCKAYKADVSNYEEVAIMVKNIVSEFSKIDVLVNNAGIAEQKVFCDVTPEDWRKMFSVNVDEVN